MLDGGKKVSAFERLVDIACRGDLVLEHLERYCATTGTDIQAASDSLALHVARCFLSGTLEFDECDLAMNSLFHVMTSEPYLELTDRSIPDDAFAVYRAFDEGEYVHPGDQPDDVPSIKYTIPLLRAVLEGKNGVYPVA